ncbi:hypothetical protein FACS1894177_01270 [Bacteroidia bacterium]|nr:hypothetical protein FACS1894177_01270 [Bacteroidia bacterium]
MNENMKNKQILLLVFSCAAVFSAAHSQTVKNDLNYRKFRISVDAGTTYSMGTSGTVLSTPLGRDFVLPSRSKNFGAGLDGAYFLTKQYGVGLKYRFYTVNCKQTLLSGYEDIENEYDYPVWERSTTSCKEQMHLLGPAVYARWFLGQSKWHIAANAGIVYLYDKLSNIKGKDEYHIEYHYESQTEFSQRPEPPRNHFYSVSDRTGATVGFTLSAGIRYQLSPSIGIGISADGLFASLSRMKYLNTFDEYETGDVTRKINRAGVSAGIDFNF